MSMSEGRVIFNDKQLQKKSYLKQPKVQPGTGGKVTTTAETVSQKRERALKKGRHLPIGCNE